MTLGTPQTITGSESYTETESGNTVSQTYTRGITGSGTYSETMVVTIGGTPTTTTSSGGYSYSLSEGAVVLSGAFSQSGGLGRYSLLVYFVDASNADASTPGNMNFSPVGRAFEDPIFAPIIVGALVVGGGVYAVYAYFWYQDRQVRAEGERLDQRIVDSQEAAGIIPPIERRVANGPRLIDQMQAAHPGLANCQNNAVGDVELAANVGVQWTAAGAGGGFVGQSKMVSAFANTRLAPTGRWQTVNEAMSAKAGAYQTQVTGRTGEAYVVNGARSIASVGHPSRSQRARLRNFRKKRTVPALVSRPTNTHHASQKSIRCGEWRTDYLACCRGRGGNCNAGLVSG